MSVQYYDSTLTAAQVEQALTAISGLIVQSNNGKLLYIENGKIIAKSAGEISSVLPDANGVSF